MTFQKPNHFTCTLAEALEWNKANYNITMQETEGGVICQHSEFQNINEYMDFLAENYSQNLAVGCVILSSTSCKDITKLTEELLNFKSLRDQSCRLGDFFLERFGKKESEQKCVALMAPSSVMYVIVWLALIRAGYEVMLLAPQNSLDATRHLLKLSKAFAICYDQDYEKSISEALLEDKSLKDFNTDTSLNNLERFKIPWLSLKSLLDVQLDITTLSISNLEKPDTCAIAFYNHSSGTTGLPKLIPQTHHGQVAVLPRLQQNDTSKLLESTYTTTPLYTGGIADLLRSWSAATPIWLFPEGKVPIIGKSVMACFRHIDSICLSSKLFTASRLAYLSCVPYVLESLLEYPELKDRLRILNAVGIGGAAMSAKLGQKLVSDNIPLVSRFGSSECGFLLSSERNYHNDRLWQVLRLKTSLGLEFERISNELYELIVNKDWPLVSTASHAQRPFNTHDIFTSHEIVTNSWIYGGRSDSQLTLQTGKKVNPIVIEEAINCHALIESVIIVGNDQPHIAAIIFESTKKVSINEDQRHQDIWNHIERVNKNLPPHARILKRSFCVLDSSHLNRIRKNNKGDVIRVAFMKEFKMEIAEIYDCKSQTKDSDTISSFSPEEIFETVQTTVNSILNNNGEILPNDDLFSFGVDSIRSIQIRKSICDLLPPKLRSSVPQNIVYECGTIDGLVNFFVKLSSSKTEVISNQNDKLRHVYMRDMVTSYLDLQPKLYEKLERQFVFGSRGQPYSKSAIALTGASGFLGAHILEKLVKDSEVTRVYLFVRGSNHSSYEEQCEQARERICSNLEFYKIKISEEHFLKIKYVSFQLSEICLGIPTPLYKEIASRITHMIHAAWEVNFSLPLKNFMSQVLGTLNIFNLILLSARNKNYQGRNPTFLYCSSVASVAHMKEKNLPSLEPFHAFNLGYSQSKWITEAILIRLQERYPEVVVSILRVGQLSGDTQKGIWNPREAWPLMIDASFYSLSENSQVLKLPDLASLGLQRIDWLPVDLAAMEIHMALHRESIKRIEFLQISNKDTKCHISWCQFQRWFSTWAKAKGFSVIYIDPQSWLDELEEKTHHAKVLISLWRANWIKEREEIKPENRLDETGFGIFNEKYFWRLFNSIFELRKFG